MPFLVDDVPPITFAADGERIAAFGMAWDGHEGIWVSNDGRSWSEITPNTGLPMVFGSEDVRMGIGTRGLVLAIDDSLWFGAWPAVMPAQ